MAKIELTDKADFSYSVDLAQDSGISKYFQGLEKIGFPNLGIAEISNDDLDKVEFKSASAGISIAPKVNSIIDNTKLTFSGEINGRVDVAKKQGDTKSPIKEDSFELGIDWPADVIYLNLGLTCKLSGGLTATVGALNCGLKVGTTATYSTYLPFRPAGEPGEYPTFIKALESLIQQFFFPGDIEDLRKLPTGAIATVDGTGSLKVSGSYKLGNVVNPLASLALPAPIASIAIAPGASVTVGASFEIAGDYQVRFCKRSESEVLIGLYRKETSTVDVSISGVAGVGSKIGDNDLLDWLYSMVLGKAEVDLSQLKGEGLPPAERLERDEVLKKVNDAIKSAISRQLELALVGDLTSVDSRKAIALFSIDLSAISEGGSSAIHSFLDGDIAGAISCSSKVGTGISLLKNSLGISEESTASLRFNFLGLVNGVDVADLLVEGTTMCDSAGNITIVDKATRTEAEGILFPLFPKDSQIQKLLADHAFMTAAYKCAGLVPEEVALTYGHSYLASDSSLSPEDASDYIRVATSLGLIPAGSNISKLLMFNNGSHLGRSLFSIFAQYDAAQCESMFFENGASRKVEDYEDIGRKALLSILGSSGIDGVRKIIADDTIWAEMKVAGFAGLNTIDAISAIVRPTGDESHLYGLLGDDLSSILWWSKAMAEVAVRAFQMREFLKSKSKVDYEDNSFKQLANALKDSLARLMRHSGKEFGLPWGLLSMYKASQMGGALDLRLITQRGSLVLGSSGSHSLGQAGAAGS